MEEDLQTFAESEKALEGQELEAYTENTLTLIGYPPSWDEIDIRKVSESYGEVTEVEVKEKFGSKPSAVIIYKSPTAQLAALENLHGRRFSDNDGSFYWLQVNPGCEPFFAPNKSAFQVTVLNICETITWEQLKYLFSQVGEAAVKIASYSSNEKGRTINIAMVSFDTAEETARAVHIFNNKKVGSKFLSVQPSVLKKSNRMFIVGNIPLDWEADELKRKLEQFGSVEKVTLKKRFAFVTFVSRKDGIKALAGLHGSSFEDEQGRRITLKFKQVVRNNFERGKILAHVHFLREQWIKKYTKTTIQLNNLDGAVVNEEILKDKFSSYGTVIKTFLIPQRNRGYVKFSTPEEATRAMTELEGQRMEDKILSLQQPNITKGDSFVRYYVSCTAPAVTSEYFWKSIHNILARYGRLQFVKIDHPENSTGTASIVSAAYHWPPAAEKALVELDGQTVDVEDGKFRFQTRSHFLENIGLGEDPRSDSDKNIEEQALGTYKENALTVFGFPPFWSENKIKKIASFYGEVDEVVLQEKLGYKPSALIIFKSPVGQLNAFENLHGRKLIDNNGFFYWLHVNPSRNPENMPRISTFELYVIGICETVTEERLKSLFSKFGEARVKLVTKEKGKIAIVSFDTAEEAAQAAHMLNNKKVGTKHILIHPYEASKSDRIFIVSNNIPLDWEPDQLKSKLEQFGSVEKVKLKNGLAFVWFATRKDGIKALVGLHGTSFEDEQGRRITLKFNQLTDHKLEHHSILTHIHFLREQWIKKYTETTIQLNNLDGAVVTEEILKDKLSSHGKIIKTFLIPQKNRGYVTFSTPDEATRAMTELQGKIFDNRSLSLSYPDIIESAPMAVFDIEPLDSTGGKWESNRFHDVLNKYGRLLLVEMKQRDFPKSDHFSVSAIYHWPPAAEKASLELDGQVIEDVETKSSVRLHFRSIFDNNLRRANQMTTIIKNISEHVSREEIQELISPYGGMISDSWTLKPGSIFVNFKSVQELKRAMRELNGIPVKGKILIMRRKLDHHIETKTLILRNVPDGWDSQKINEVFGEYGNVSNLSIKKNECSITYESATEANAALVGLKGKSLFGSQPLLIHHQSIKRMFNNQIRDTAVYEPVNNSFSSQTRSFSSYTLPYSQLKKPLSSSDTQHKNFYSTARYTLRPLGPVMKVGVHSLDNFVMKKANVGVSLGYRNFNVMLRGVVKLIKFL